MYYEINVSRGGKHFLATAPRSITTEEKAREVYHALTRAFPLTPEGEWGITVSLVMQNSRQMNVKHWPQAVEGKYATEGGV